MIQAVEPSQIADESKELGTHPAMPTSDVAFKPGIWGESTWGIPSTTAESTENSHALSQNSAAIQCSRIPLVSSTCLVAVSFTKKN